MARDRGGSWYAGRAAGREARGGYRRRIRGDRAFRRLLKGMPEAIRDEVVAMLEATGDQILAAQRADSPSTRATAALSKRVSRATLRLRVGLIGRPINRRLFFARILQGGRKAQNVQVRRSSGGGISSYEMRVRAMAGKPFVHSARTRAIRDRLGGKIEPFWRNVLQRASQGVSDD